MFKLLRFSTNLYKSRNVRFMSGHAKTDKGDQDALEKFVRKYLPENEHIALAIIGFYTSLYAIYSVFPKKIKSPTGVTIEGKNNGSDIPSIESDQFGGWIAVDGNLELFLTKSDN